MVWPTSGASSGASQLLPPSPHLQDTSPLPRFSCHSPQDPCLGMDVARLEAQETLKKSVPSFFGGREGGGGGWGNGRVETQARSSLRALRKLKGTAGEHQGVGLAVCT